jgi:polysaccharide export outer membrane protein
MIDYSLSRRGSRHIERRIPVLLALCLGLAGCSGFGASGPSAATISKAGERTVAQSAIRVVDLDEMVARQVSATSSLSSFSNSFESVRPVGSVLGPGDLVDVTIWEAPPAVLYGANSGELRTATASTTTARSTTLPEQMIDGSGRLSIPFAGAVVAAGRTPREVEQIVAAQLIGKANQPQVIVRLVRNATANVTVVGEVTNSTRLPLSPKGERLLDAVAAAGGVRQPVGKTMIQVSRAGRVVAMPLEAVIKDPVQNIVLAADDVVTAYYQPFSFTALGAVNNNAEIPFEATGLTLAQALGRIGGLNDDRANARGVFIFRLENPSALGQRLPEGAALTPDGKIPVIYRVDLKNPASFFVAQGFPIRNRDVLYVSNAPVTDLQKFMNIVSSMAFSVVGVANAI